MYDGWELRFCQGGGLDNNGEDCFNNIKCRNRLIDECLKKQDCVDDFLTRRGFKPESVKDITPEKWVNMIPRGEASIEDLNSEAQAAIKAYLDKSNQTGKSTQTNQNRGQVRAPAKK